MEKNNISDYGKVLAVADILAIAFPYKVRDPKEPGRIEKELAENRLARLIRKRFRTQKKKIEESLNWTLPKKSVSDWMDRVGDIDDPETEALIFVLFLGAYKFGLLPKKADDQIDLEYLFYLPFCHVFSTMDKFHMTLAPSLMRKDQVLLPGEDLKKGIQEIESLPAHEETMKANCVPVPPMPKKSIIRKNSRIKKFWLSILLMEEE